MTTSVKGTPVMFEYGKCQDSSPKFFYLMTDFIPPQPNNARSTWFMKRAVHLAWTRAHTRTQVQCVRITKWMVASVLLVRVIYLNRL